MVNLHPERIFKKLFQVKVEVGGDIEVDEEDLEGGEGVPEKEEEELVVDLDGEAYKASIES